MNEVVLIDAGVGNLHSVHKALEHVGARVHRTQDPEVVRRASKMVLPGVGAFGDFMAGLRQHGLEEAVMEALNRGAPLLGICVGMQALFEVSYELGTHAGLGLLPGEVRRFPDQPGLKIPHTGWNQIWIRKTSYCVPASEAPVVAETDYGLRYASVVQKDHIFGVQFHPEKSQRVGLHILANFVERVAGV